ncbi:MAG TPA: hypothetical protein VGC41_29560 [Kofleriaceae bacterium]
MKTAAKTEKKFKLNLETVKVLNQNQICSAQPTTTVQTSLKSRCC